MVKNPPANAEDMGSVKIPWRREWQPTPVFLAGESHGQRSLAGYSPWGPKQSDMTERLNSSKVCNAIVSVLISPAPHYLVCSLEDVSGCLALFC